MSDLGFASKIKPSLNLTFLISDFGLNTKYVLVFISLFSKTAYNFVSADISKLGFPFSLRKESQCKVWDLVSPSSNDPYSFQLSNPFSGSAKA